jgi:hypothetical protein
VVCAYGNYTSKRQGGRKRHGKLGGEVAVAAGLEPATTGLTIRRSTN